MTTTVPVTVIGGYLGAGKTTLLNRALGGDHGQRLAVLVNDFGSVNIDADLIVGHGGRTISLENGCICCSITDSLGDALDEVLAMSPPPDQILIEASGVAEPAQITGYAQGWPGCRLDAVIVLADVELVRRQARDEYVGDLVVRQLEAADMIVLTKCDLVRDPTLAEVEDWLVTGPVQATTVVRSAADDSVGSEVEEWLLASAGRSRLANEAAVEAGPSVTPGETGPSVSSEDTNRVGAASIFVSVDAVFDEPVERSRLIDELESWPASVVRVKGVIDVGHTDAPTIVNRVGRRWSLTPWPVDQAMPADRYLVLIGVRGQDSAADDLAALLTAIASGEPS